MYWTNFAEDRILRTFLGSTAQAPPVVYAALFLSNPGASGGGTEVTYPGYERQPITFSAPSVIQGGASITNVSDILFPRSPQAAGTITFCALADSLIGGNIWAYAALDEPISVTADTAPLIRSAEWHYLSSGNFTNAFKAACLNLLRGQSITGFQPAVALFNGSPDGGGAELSGGGYARIPIIFGAPEIQPAGQTMISNSAIATSNIATESWGTLTDDVIFDAASGGMAVASRHRDSSVIMGRTSAASIAIGELSVSVD